MPEPSIAQEAGDAGPTAGSPLRVLVVARWYPAYDDTTRGRFVADHVAALVGRGVDVTVASFEPVFVHGPAESRASRGAEARATWRLDDARATNVPQTWGARVPVARLPVVLSQGERSPMEEAEAHAAALEGFAVALAARWPFDVLHAHTGLPDGVASLRVARRLGLPLVVTEHDSALAARLVDPAALAAYRDLADRSTVLAVSRALAAEVAMALGLAPDAIGVLPNPVDVDAFAAIGAARDENELLYVGNRKASKGIESLLRAFAEVRATRPGLSLRLIGRSPDAEDEARWETLAADLGIAAGVAFDPPQPRSGIASAMARASVFVHPSPRETFGVVAAEALASGLPVAAAPSEGVREILGMSGAYGELAGDLDPSSLATAIARVLDRRPSFDPAALRARAAGYSPASIAGRTMEIYESLIERGGSGHRGARTATGTSRRPTDAATLPDPPPLLVGLTRPEAARLVAGLPPDLAARLTAVTTRASIGSPPLPEVLPSGPRWIEIDPDRTHLERLARLPPPLPRGASVPARLLAFLRSPRAAGKRRRLFESRQRLRDETLTAGVRDAWSELGSQSGRGAAASELLAVALDAEAALELARVGARLAPGALRWLVDAWDAARKEQEVG